MTTQLKIYNMTLRRLNCESVTALDDTTKQEKVLDDFYDDVVLDSLAAFPWPFATKEVSFTTVTNILYYECAIAHTAGDFTTDLASVNWTVVAEDTTIDPWATEAAYSVGDKVSAPIVRWNRKLTLPSDYVKAIREYNSLRYVRQGAEILTNEKTLNLIYTWNNTTVTNFPPDFVHYLYLRLALEGCHALTQDKKLRLEIQAELDDVLDTARSRVSQESTPDDFEIDTFTGDREYSTFINVR